MWAQKKKHSNYGGDDNGGVPFALKTPKFKGVEDIEALLAQSEQNDRLEKEEREREQEERERSKGRSFCGC